MMDNDPRKFARRFQFFKSRWVAMLVVAIVFSSISPLSCLAQSSSNPALTYSSFLGGGSPATYNEGAYGMALGPDGAVYVVGYTESAYDFPFTHRLDPNADRGTFVVKFDPSTKVILYATLIPACVGRAIAVDAAGDVYIAGSCSYNLTLVNPFQQNYGGGDDDAFVAKLSADGTRLIYSTFLGGAGVDMARQVMVDSLGQVIVSGLTESTNFPITSNGVVQPQLGGRYDAFVAKLSASGASLLYSTYLGGKGDDYGLGMGRDGLGNIYISGQTTSTNFAGSSGIVHLGTNGLAKAFVAKLAPDFTSLRYVTFFGGNGNDCASALAVDASGNAYVYGQTSSTNFPVTASAFQKQFGGDSADNFVAKLGPTGANLVYATYLGGSSSEDNSEPVYANNGYLYLPRAGIAIDNSGNAYVASGTQSADIAPNIAANLRSGASDGYVAKINASGSALLFFRYLGSSRDSLISALALDANGNVFVTGTTFLTPDPPYFPITPGALQAKYAGGVFDAFLAEFSENATGGANDHFSNRLSLTGSRLTVQANNTSATLDLNEPQVVNATGKSLWWSWTAPATGTLGISTLGSSFDTLLAVYTNNTLATLRSVAGNDDENAQRQTSLVRFPVVAGTVYQIAVDGKNGASGSISLSLTFSAPSNDDFVNRTQLAGFPINAAGSNVDATLEPGEPREDYYGDRSVWWTWTSPLDGNIAVTTSGSSFDTVLAVYTGNSMANLVLAAPPNDNETNGLSTSRITLQVTMGTIYQIVVSGKNDSSGMIQLSLLPSIPPVNDNFSGRTLLTGTLIHLTNINASATGEPGEPNLGFEMPGGKSLWWTWKAPSNGWVNLDTEGSNFDTRLGVFTGAQLNNLTLVAANDDQRVPGDSYYLSRTVFEVTSNTVYNIVADGSQRFPAGRLVFNLFFYQPPKITTNSAVWSAANFQFQVTGVPGPTYNIEASSNLTVWTVISSNWSGPMFNVSDTNSALRQRFYRVVQP